MQAHAVYETAAIVAALEHDGCALVTAAIAPQQCSSACAHIDALEPLHWDETHARNGRHLDRYLNVFNRDPYWLQFLDRPGIIEAAEAVLGSDCHIIGETAWRSHPGFRGEPLHVDYAPLERPEGAPRDDVRIPIFLLTVHFYLNDLTADLAPTRVVPGSHRSGRAPRAEAEPVLACAGDALLFRSDVWHAGSDNRTASDVRYLLQVHYGRREMAQHFSPYLEWRFDRGVLAAASRRQRRLLGDHEPGAYD